MVVIGLVWLFQVTRFVAGAEKAQGTILRIEEEGGEKNTLTRSVFAYSDRFGAIYTQKTSVATATFEHSPGEIVEVIYNPKHPI